MSVIIKGLKILVSVVAHTFVILRNKPAVVTVASNTIKKCSP
jgi:hypothetical protein